MCIRDSPCNVADHLNRQLALRRVDCGNKYASVLFHINLCAGIGNDLLNNLAARPDQIADLIHINRQGSDLRRIR